MTWQNGLLSAESAALILEGVFCLAAELREVYTYKVWCRADPKLRLARGLARDGEEARSSWVDLWMPAEAEYESREKPEEAADLILDSSQESGGELASMSFDKTARRKEQPSMATKEPIILLNGTSSSGKTTFARALRSALDPHFHYYASDQLADEGFRPLVEPTRFLWREAFFDGFHRSIASFADAGLDLLVEHIVEEASWAEQLAQVLSGFDVFWVGVHAPVAELQRREQMRGDRQAGEALEHLKTHGFCRYDVEVDTTKPVTENVAAVLEAWNSRRSVQS